MAEHDADWQPVAVECTMRLLNADCLGLRVGDLVWVRFTYPQNVGHIAGAYAAVDVEWAYGASGLGKSARAIVTSFVAQSRR
jgi:hypothetical protein